MMTSPSSVSAPKGVRPYPLIVALVVVIEATGIFEQTMYYTAIPTLMRVFEMDAAGISWGVTLFLLVGAGTVAISGRLGDTYGRKRMLIILMAVSLVGSAISVIGANYQGVLVGRALQGTSAALFPLLVGIIREVVPAPRVPVLVSIATGTALIAGSLGALVAGILLEAGDWRSMFLASGILALVALVFSAAALPRSVVEPGPRPPIDVLGGVLLAPAVAAALFGFQMLRTAVSGFAIGLIVVGVVLAAGWIVLELRVRHPMFDLRMFRVRALTLTLVATAMAGLGTFGGTSLLNPILMQSPTSLPVGLGLTPTVAGLYGLITGVIGFALAPLAGRIASRTGARTTFLIGTAAALVGFLGFAFGVHSLPVALAGTVVLGVGTSFLLAGLPNLVVEVVPPHATGEAVGLVYGVGRTLFSAAGTAVIAMLLVTSTVPQTTAPTYSAWLLVVAFMAVTALVGGAAVLLIRRATPMADRAPVIDAVAEVEPEARRTA